MQMNVITVARQIGCRGDWIAEQVAKKLGYDLVDQRLVEEIAKITDTSVEEVEQFDEKGEKPIRYFLKRLLLPDVAPGTFPLSASAYAPEFGLEFSYAREHNVENATYLDRGTYQLLITTLIQDFGQTGRAVIVGRASQIILSGRPDVRHVKIIAPFEQRAEYIANNRSITLTSARKIVEQHDNWRQTYLRNAHGADWEDPLLYDLTLNMANISAEKSVNIIINHVLND
jgi:cytidylate kinase